MANVWDRRNEQDRAEFASLLAPLIVASRSKDFDGEKAKPQLHVWMMSLHDVPKDVLRESVERLIQRGITWMPRPGEVRTECASVVSSRRRAMAARGAAVIAECDECHGSTWREGADGRVSRCDCHAHALRLQEGLPVPLALLSGDRSERSEEA